MPGNTEGCTARTLPPPPPADRSLPAPPGVITAGRDDMSVSRHSFKMAMGNTCKSKGDH